MLPDRFSKGASHDAFFVFNLLWLPCFLGFTVSFIFCWHFILHTSFPDTQSSYFSHLQKKKGKKHCWNNPSLDVFFCPIHCTQQHGAWGKLRVGLLRGVSVPGVEMPFINTKWIFVCIYIFHLGEEVPSHSPVYNRSCCLCLNSKHRHHIYTTVFLSASFFNC